MSNVIFKLPNSPEEFGVTLPPAELRKLDFSALDYNTLNRACVEYIRTYHPNDFNDFFASNGVMMLTELVAYIGNVLAQRSDILIDEAFLPTATTKDAVIEHLALLNQKIQAASPAVVDVQIALTNPTPTEVRIPARTQFYLTGPDQKPLYYEIYRAPGDFTSDIIIPAGKRGVVAYGIEGLTNTPITMTSAGGPGQVITIPYSNVLDEPITVDVTSGSNISRWNRIDIIENAGSNDHVYEVKRTATNTLIIFGDDVTGKAPFSGQVITVTFRQGGGTRGRIAAGIINESRPVTPQPPYSAAVTATFTNPNPSSGGTDEETIEQAKKRGPRQFATHNSAVTGEDYSLMALSFKHPVYGAVSKAIAVIRTGVEMDMAAIAKEVREAPSDEAAAAILTNKYVNRNIVELYVLAEGPDNTLSKPSTGLKQGLIQYFSELNVLTDEVRVYDGAIKPVNVNATITLSRNADPGTVKAAVLKEVQSFFDLRNFDMGTGMYLSNLYNVIQNISGVKFVDIYKPTDDVLTTNQIANPASTGVGFNEVIVLGETNIQFYFEPGNYRVPPTNKI